MEILKRKEECCGCGLCAVKCPNNAIIMQADDKGFFYPNIDNEKCSNCGMCIRECPSKKNIKKQFDGNRKEAYACINEEESIRNSSSSGGVFFELAKQIIDSKGAVCGAVFDENWTVKHICTENILDVLRMRGSKYVQSDMGSIYVDIQQKLAEKRMVLFSGCPCQCAAVKAFFKNDENLLTVDLVCHAAPSPKFWKDYVKYHSDEKKIIDVSFRNKIFGWRQPGMLIQTELSRYLEQGSYDYYFQAFYKGYINRECCFECKYTSLNRQGDITLADFWGIEKIFPEMDDNKGVSMVLINTEKGDSLFEEVKTHFIYKKTEITHEQQPQLSYPTKKSNRYNEFWTYYFARGMKKAIKKYLGGDILSKIKRIVKKSLSHFRI